MSQKLYCAECGEYLMGGDGECHDCSCGWKQFVPAEREVKLTASHADTCLPSFWGGHHLPHIQVTVHKGMTLAALKSALNNELNEGALMGSNVGDDAWSSGPDGDAWYEAARQAISEIAAKAGTGDETPLFNELDEVDEDDDGCESVYAFFVFVEAE